MTAARIDGRTHPEMAPTLIIALSEENERLRKELVERFQVELPKHA